jgi:catechol 2,3-dioxygenase-like lactoylglutathione lyase family enzyme
MMIDHVSLGVTDVERSRRFYDSALAPLGIVPCSDLEHLCDYALDGSDDFGIIELSSGQPFHAPPKQNHVAFGAKSRAAVDAFHAAALANGGRDDGSPGLRPEYHPGYYAAFVLDPDGHRIEAVFHDR